MARRIISEVVISRDAQAKMIDQQQIDSFYMEFESIDCRSEESLPALRDLYPRVKQALDALQLNQKYHKIYESTSGPVYNLRFFKSEEISVAASIKGREYEFYADEHIDQFDRHILHIAIHMQHLRLRVDYAIDDLQEMILARERNKRTES